MTTRVYQWTDKGSVLAGRLTGDRVLEAYRPDGDLADAPPALFHATQPVTETLGTVQQERSPRFTYRRAGHSQDHVLEVGPGGATLDGSPITPEELELVCEHAEGGVAELRFLDPPLAKGEADGSPAEDTSTDPATGCENLLGFAACQPPLLCVGVVGYAEAWAADPSDAQGLVRCLSACLAEEQGGRFRLVGGSLALEVPDLQAAVEAASRVMHRVRATVAGSSGQLRVGLEFRQESDERWVPPCEGLRLPDGTLIR